MASDLLTAALHGALPYLDMPQRCRHLVEEAGSPLAATLLAPMHGQGGEYDVVRQRPSSCLSVTQQAAAALTAPQPQEAGNLQACECRCMARAVRSSERAWQCPQLMVPARAGRQVSADWPFACWPQWTPCWRSAACRQLLQKHCGSEWSAADLRGGCQSPSLAFQFHALCRALK